MSRYQAKHFAKKPLPEVSPIQRAFCLIKDVYVVCALVLMMGITLIPLQLLIPRVLSFIYASVPAIGFVLVVWGLIGRFIRVKFTGIIPLVIMQLAIIVSVVVYRQYHLIDNAKSIIWMTIPVFVLYCPTKGETSERHLRWLLKVLVPFGIVFSLFSAGSIVQFALMYGEVLWDVFKESSFRCGYIDGRLFGLFTDPNYAALAALLLSMGMLAAVRYKAYGKFVSFLSIVAIVFNMVYIVLSESRGAVLSLVGVAAFVGMVFGCRAMVRGKPRSKIAVAFVSLLAGVLCVGVMVGAYMGGKQLLSTVPPVLTKLVYGPDGAPKTPNLTNDAKWLAEQDKKEAEKEDDKSDKSTGSESSEIDLGRPDAASGRDISNNRFTIWKDGVSVWLASPILGATPRGYLDFAKDALGDIYIVQRQYTLHNAYVSVLVFGGIAASIAVIWWMVIAFAKIIRFLKRGIRRTDKTFFVFIVLSAALLATFIDSLVLTSIFYNNMFVDYIFWLTVGSVMLVEADEHDE